LNLIDRFFGKKVSNFIDIRYSCQILTKLEFNRQIFRKGGIKFHRYPLFLSDFNKTWI